MEGRHRQPIMLGIIVVFFTALHTMQVGVSHEISVRPSLCLSNAGIVKKRKKLLPKLLHRIKGPFI